VLLNLSTSQPTVGSLAVSEIADTSVRAGAEVIAQGRSPIVDRGFVYVPEAVSPDPRIGGQGVTKVSVQGSLGSFDSLLPGLSIGTSYVLRAFATNDSGTSYTGVTRFSTTSPAKATLSDVSQPEGYSSGSMVFAVRLSTTLEFDSSLRYSTINGSATAGTDYAATSGTLHFAAGEDLKSIIVPVNGDAAIEPNETFSVVLSEASGIWIVDASATGTLLNDDGPTISVTDFSTVEHSGAGTTNLVFTVMTSQTSSSPITVSYATSDGSATAGSDYAAMSGAVTLHPGWASIQIKVPVVRDSDIEPNETLFLQLTSATNASIADGLAVGTIIADDGLLVSIGDKTSREGDTGTTIVTLPVTLGRAATETVTVAWATTNGTATAPSDYQSESGTVTFNAGETSTTITVQIAGDTLKESYETFFVTLSNPTGGATIGDGQGQVTISNTDGSTDRSRLLFHNFVTNRLFRWHMKGGNTLDTYNWVTPWSTDPGWTVGAVADFDQDGQVDYLWHNVRDGRMLFWYIDGDNLKAYEFLPYLMSAPWSVATTFDGNNDGAVDIAYYNSTTGAVRVVLHDNARTLGQYDLSRPLPGAEPLRVVNAVDANKDGDDELLLYNSATGRVSAWDVNGATVESTVLHSDAQSTTQAFTLVSAKTDFNDDGRPDFLWHNRTTGLFSVWFMDGMSRLDVGVFQPFTATDPVWRVVGSANLW
jgi:Calx-beta domain